MPDEFSNEFLDVHRLGTISRQGQENHAESRLQWRILEELIENHLFVSIPLEHNMQANLPSRCGAVCQIDNAGDPFNLVVTHELFEFLSNTVAGFEIRDLGHFNNVSIFLCEKAGFCPECQCAATVRYP